MIALIRGASATGRSLEARLATAAPPTFGLISSRQPMRYASLEAKKVPFTSFDPRITRLAPASVGAFLIVASPWLSWSAAHLCQIGIDFFMGRPCPTGTAPLHGV